jgi:hypothetical protein
MCAIVLTVPLHPFSRAPGVVILDAERANALRDKAEEMNQAGGTSRILVIRQNEVPKGMLSYSDELQKVEKQGPLPLPDITVLPEDGKQSRVDLAGACANRSYCSCYHPFHIGNDRFAQR